MVTTIAVRAYQSPSSGVGIGMIDYTRRSGTYTRTVAYGPARATQLTSGTERVTPWTPTYTGLSGHYSYTGEDHEVHSGTRYMSRSAAPRSGSQVTFWDLL